MLKRESACRCARLALINSCLGLIYVYSVILHQASITHLTKFANNNERAHRLLYDAKSFHRVTDTLEGHYYCIEIKIFIFFSTKAGILYCYIFYFFFMGTKIESRECPLTEFAKDSSKAASFACVSKIFKSAPVKPSVNGPNSCKSKSSFAIFWVLHNDLRISTLSAWKKSNNKQNRDC